MGLLSHGVKYFSNCDPEVSAGHCSSSVLNVILDSASFSLSWASLVRLKFSVRWKAWDEKSVNDSLQGNPNEICDLKITCEKTLQSLESHANYMLIEL